MIVVYRGLQLTAKQILGYTKLKDYEDDGSNDKVRPISFSSFISASTDKKSALAFAKKAGSKGSNKIGVLMQIQLFGNKPCVENEGPLEGEL